MKPFIVVQGPVATRSGYGNHTRDLVTALIKADKYEVGIISMKWGDTPMNALLSDSVSVASYVPLAKEPLHCLVGVSASIFFSIAP